MLKINNYILYLQHLAANNILFLIISLKIYLVNFIMYSIGLLYYRMEKLIKYKRYIQIMPYFDRLYMVLIIVKIYIFYLVNIEFVAKEILKNKNMIKSKIVFKFLLFILFNIIVVLNLWNLLFLNLNSGNVILEKVYQVYNLIVIAHGLLMVFFVVMPILIGIFGNFFFPILIGALDIDFSSMNNLNFWFLPFSLFFMIKKNFYSLINLNTFFNLIFFLSKKIKFSFYLIIVFFIITLIEGNFSYVSCSDDLPLPNNGGSPIEGLIYFLFIIIIGFISAKHNSNRDNSLSSSSSSSSLSTNSLDIKEIDEINKVITNPILINENKNIPKVNLLDEILINKLISYGFLVFGFGVMWFVIYKVLYLYNNPTKPKIYSKKFKKK